MPLGKERHGRVKTCVWENVKGTRMENGVSFTVSLSTATRRGQGCCEECSTVIQMKWDKMKAFCFAGGRDEAGAQIHLALRHLLWSVRAEATWASNVNGKPGSEKWKECLGKLYLSPLLGRWPHTVINKELAFKKLSHQQFPATTPKFYLMELHGPFFLYSVMEMWKQLFAIANDHNCFCITWVIFLDWGRQHRVMGKNWGLETNRFALKPQLCDHRQFT